MLRVRVYEVKDEDVIRTFFGEDAPMRRLAELGEQHGELIFSDNEAVDVPGDNDVLLLPGKLGLDEYIIMQRLYNADEHQWTLLVHAPHYDHGGVSS